MLVDTYFRIKELIQPKTQVELIAAGYQAALQLIEDMKPKADKFDLFMSGKNNQDMNDVAKTLGWGRNKLFKQLRDDGILLNNNTPRQTYIDRGYFVVIQKPIEMGGSVIDKPQTMVTPKGVEWLADHLDKYSLCG